MFDKFHQIVCGILVTFSFMGSLPIFAQNPKQSDIVPPAPVKLDEEEPYKALETLAHALFYVENMYVDPTKVKPDAIVHYALDGIVQNLDPHSVILPKKAFEQLTIDTRGKFGGVGVIVSQEHNRLIVISAVEGTPAKKAGIQSGDEIMAVDDQQVAALKGNEALDLMRGAPGTKLKLSIKRKNVKDLLDFNLVREVIKITSVRGIKLSGGVYYVRISNFQENTSDELLTILEQYRSDLKGLILDLRDNPGGLLDQAIKVVDLFIESGLIVSTVGRDPDRIEREFAHQGKTFTGFPMITLVNDGSASASEIVAGALQDHERSLIMGLQTFGKGSVQTLITLPDGSGLKLTVARYYTPKDRSIQAVGIKPDVQIPAKKFVPPAAGETKERRKESDLERHIEGGDLNQGLNHSGLLDTIKDWPESMRDDYQLVTAFTYLKGWVVFQPKK